MWVRLEGDLARVGITSTAQEALGEIVFVDLPKHGANIEAAAAFSWIESGKAVVDLLSPISGRVTHRNNALVQTPGVINSDPYGAGWLCVVEPGDQTEFAKLMDSHSYACWVEGLR